MKKARVAKFIFGLSFIVLSVVLSFGFSGCFKSKDAKLREYVNNNFGIELSKEDKILLEADNIGFGDGILYFVIQFAEEPTEILNEKDFYTNKYIKATDDEREKILSQVKKRFNQIIDFVGLDIETLDEICKPDWDAEFLIAGSGIYAEATIVHGISYYYNVECSTLIIAYDYL